MEKPQHWSRLKGFFDLSIMKRRQILATLPVAVDENDFSLADVGLKLSDADRMSENVIATFSLPFSIAANFIVDEQPVLIPMVTEEPSVVAACSKMAKIVSGNGGFHTKIDRALIKGQIQLYHVRDVDKVVFDFNQEKQQLLDEAKRLSSRMATRGGGVVDIGIRVLPSPMGPMVIFEPLVDVVDAMGANAVNTLVEALAHKVSKLFLGTIGIKILSNLCDERLAHAHCKIELRDLALDPGHDLGLGIGERMLFAHALAKADIYRACTHNKGILNGIDAVALATGNDFRAIEAGAHAYAARLGHYQPLTTMSIDEKSQILSASLTLPLAVGVVGGNVKVHNGVRLAHKMLGPFAHTSKQLASVMVSAGLSQCLAALLALCQDGIQKGHMKLHNKKLNAVNQTPSGAG